MNSGYVIGATFNSWKVYLIIFLKATTMPATFGTRTKQVCSGGLSLTRGYLNELNNANVEKILTFTFLISAARGSEVKPIVIWKSEKPRCFKGVNKSQLPVLCYSHSKVWMTGGMLDYLLSQINRKLRGNSHSVLTLMNNTGCHLENLIQKYTNIKILIYLLTLLSFFTLLI